MYTFITLRLLLSYFISFFLTTCYPFTFPLEPIPFMWALTDRCSLCLFLRTPWSARASRATLDRSILSPTGRLCVPLPSVTLRVMFIPAARAVSRCGISVTRATRPLSPSWTASWVQHWSFLVFYSHYFSACLRFNGSSVSHIRTEITTSDPAGYSLMDELSLSGAKRVLYRSGIWLRRLLGSKQNWLHQHLRVMLWLSVLIPKSAFPAAPMETSLSGIFTTRLWLGTEPEKLMYEPAIKPKQQ